MDGIAVEKLAEKLGDWIECEGAYYYNPGTWGLTNGLAYLDGADDQWHLTPAGAWAVITGMDMVMLPEWVVKWKIGMFYNSGVHDPDPIRAVEKAVEEYYGL